MTVRQNTKMRKQIERMQPAATDDIRDIISRCENKPELRVLGNMIRVIANTGLLNGEFGLLRRTDIDPAGTWLHVGRQRTAASPARTFDFATLNWPLSMV